jgi:DNA-binding transcriptional LysR family regulator
MSARITISQLQSLVAIVDRGSFAAAGKQTGLAQSAVSRNIRELENSLGATLFERDGRASKLTAQGERVTRKGRAVLQKWQVICEEFAKPTLLHRTLRMGITEIAAQTWLPRFVTAFHAALKDVELHLEVSAMATELVEKVRCGELEIAMVSEVKPDTGIVTLPLGEMQCGWYCRPDFPAPERVVTLQDLMSFQLVMQDNVSPAGLLVMQWLASQNVRPVRVVHSNSFAALGGLTVAGLGIGCLPEALARELVDRGMVRPVRTSPEIPAMRYVTVLRDGTISPFLARVAELAASACDLNQRYQEVET